MSLSLSIAKLIRRGRGLGLSAWAPLALLIPAASCVPAGLAMNPEVTLTRAEIAAFTAPVPQAAVSDAALANAAIPVSSGSLQTANAYVFTGRTPLDQMRSADCLAQAIYYEARSQSEEGQRAVAQVVLNRVRHPAWPNSVCGVVYQGAMRPGGGCQFTFTCDGSLATRPSGANWAQAQRLAVEALAGRTFAPVGLSTFYHANYVFPAWAPRLVKTAQIGAHIFYQLPGLAGAPGAFSNAYAGTEPFPRPTMTLVNSRGGAIPADMTAAAVQANLVPARFAAPAPPPSDIAQQARWTPSNLPDSTIREEHAQSGQWRTDAPAAVTGR
jgi:spore germination cell wall hydrolase CwlJ-like protein